MTQHAVILEFTISPRKQDDLIELDRELQEVFEKSTEVEYDGYEMNVDQTTGSLYFYGRDGDVVFGVVSQLSTRFLLFEDLIATIRYGDVNQRDAPEKVVKVR